MLRIVGEEERPTYDGIAPASKPNGCGFAMIPSAVFDLNDGHALAVYAVLAKHADRQTGECWPAIKTICERLGWSRKLVEPALKRLIEAGLIEKQRRTLHGMDQASLYRLTAYGRVVPTEPAVVPTAPLGSSQGTTGSFRGNYEQESTELEPEEQEIYAPAAPKPKRTIYPADFEQFWQAYPEQNGVKAKALDQWKRLTGDERQRVMSELPAWKQSQRWADGYVKHAERWLRDREWEGAAPPASKRLVPDAPKGELIVNGKAYKRRGWVE